MTQRIRFGLITAGFLTYSASVGLAADVDTKLDMLGRLIRDVSPKVRLEAVRALGKIPKARAAELALTLLDKPMDATLDYALWLTINDLSEPWIEALQSGTWKPDGREKQLEFALKSIKPEQARRVLGKILEHLEYATGITGPDGIDILALLQDFARHIQRQIIGIDDATDETQIGRAHV